MDRHMSAQLLELLFFAGIAFFIINKLISVLGTTSDEDPTKNRSYFGESTGLKDVTDTTNNSASSLSMPDFLKKKAQNNNIDICDLIVLDNEKMIMQGLTALQERLPTFDPKNFLRGAKSAFQMIIELSSNDQDKLAELLDKRYIEQFNIIAPNYGNVQNISNLEAKISEIYMFGNNVFIKIIFSGNAVTDKITNLYEEWTFSKSLIISGNEWYLGNIERLQ